MVQVFLVCAVVLSAPQAPPAADRPPEALTRLRDAAVASFSPALHGDWTTVSMQVSTVEAAARDLPLHTGPADLAQQLRGHVLALRRAVRGHQRAVAAQNANWIARIADEMATRYEMSTPADVRLLAFFGRAIEVDAMRHQSSRAKADVADLRTVWIRVEPSVLARNDIDGARQFGDALAGLDGAMAGGGLQRAAETEVTAADQIAQLFRGTTNS